MFVRMCEAPMDFNTNKTKERLFINVFMFLFRNTNVVQYEKCQLILGLFLKYIQSYELDDEFKDRQIIDSVNNSVSCEPNKVLFINENGMLCFYKFFGSLKKAYAGEYLKLCDSVCSLDSSQIYALSFENITNGVNKIIWKLDMTRRIVLEKLLFMIFKMLSRLRILNHIEFKFDMFHEITFLEFTSFPEPYNEQVIKDLSKTWISIINVFGDRLEFDYTQEMMFASCVYSVYFINKLRKVNDGSGHFEMTKITKQGVLIIYFTLYAYPWMKNRSKRWLRNVLQYLHGSFKKYFKKCSIEDRPIEDQFFLLIYYLRSHVALEIKPSPHDEELFEAVVERLQTYPSMKLHSSLIESHLLLVFTENLTSAESNHPDTLRKIKRFVKNLILALSDEWHIYKVENERKLHLFESFKNVNLSIFNDDYIMKTLSKSYKHLRNSYSYYSPQPDESKALAMTNHTFNQYGCIPRTNLDYLLQLCEGQNTPGRYENIPDLPNLLQSYPHLIFIDHLPFPALLKWMIYFFEMKFVFGEDNCKAENITNILNL
ncbi:hypothetical protein RF11_02785 [Thelohanellus kitauei]|uniref:Uncharacterized protein n=1 Tax=Thelohanellus kitauei TaxID=669202 RepID=A0A0C2MRJ8_THEKT|nr:hypothetical protein RF11_02785 [Thelohanellus kitauei]